MGCGASVTKPSNKSKTSSTSTHQRVTADKPNSEVPNRMASLQGHAPDNHMQADDDTKLVHIIDINDGFISDKKPERIECDDIVEFKIDGKDEYDIIQVYKDGNDYYRVDNGFKLTNIKNRTLKKNRQISFSYDLNQPELELYFCIILSSERETIAKTRKLPKNNCEKNCLKLYQSEIKFTLNDTTESQKVYLHKGDTVEVEWATKENYRIEERKFCPVSGGLYTVAQTPNNISNRFSKKGTFKKTFTDFGMSFLFRLTDKNKIHDVIVCIINESYEMKLIEIADNNIQPNIIWIEQNDWIVFDWNTKTKQSVTQIEPFTIDQQKQQSIELKTPGKNVFWPNGTTRRGHMRHQFKEPGIYCYKTATDQIGTIIVEARQNIYHVPVFGENLIHSMNTNDLIQFDWRMDSPTDEPVQLTIDPQSSVVPHAIGGIPEVFNCATHKCTKVEQTLQRHFHTCETLIFNIPQHGVYNFAHSKNRDAPLISIVVENGIDNHRVAYDEHNSFEPNTLIINRNDQVWFDSSSTKVATIYETDEFGNGLEADQPIFHPQENSINYFMKKFSQLGIYYFSTERNDNENNNKENDEQMCPLAIIVIPEVRFHYRSVREQDFDNQSIITNVNDYVIWTFDNIISHNVAHVNSNISLNELIACHDKAVVGRKRKCLGVECIQSGTFFFANPEFERVVGSEDRLIASIIVEPPFSQNSFIIGTRQFTPNVLNIGQNDTVSWVLSTNDSNHRIYVQPRGEEEEIDEDYIIHRRITDFVHNVHHLHTFNKPGEYTIRSNRFQKPATVVVYSQDQIKNQKKRVQEPNLIEDIDSSCPAGTQVHLVCPNRNANMHYTTDGSPPTRFSDAVHDYDPKHGILLEDTGLHVIRAYAAENDKISSTVMTSSPTFVMASAQPEPEPEPPQQLQQQLQQLQQQQLQQQLQQLQQQQLQQQLQQQPQLQQQQPGLLHNAPQEVIDSRNTYEITLSATLQQPNKVYGKINIEPANAINSIDYFELYINDIAQKTHIAPTNLQFSADGFAAGEQYEIYVTAHPKTGVAHGAPISSNKRAFEIKREISNGGPLISLAVSNDPNVLVIQWAHIKDNVSEYIVYVDDTERKILAEKNFNDFYGIQFYGVQQNKTYPLYVEAKIKDSNTIRKSNTISVTTPLEMTVHNPSKDGYVPYIKINSDTTPADAHVEESSDRLSSPKLSAQNSSSPSSPLSPTASSRPSVHLLNTNNTTLNTSESIPQKTDKNDDHKTNNLKKKQQSSSSSPVTDDTSITKTEHDENTTKPIPKTRKQKSKQQEQNDSNFILSKESKQRAQILLEQLTQSIENRSTPNRPRSQTSLSDDSKRRAQIILAQLTESIENRSKSNPVHLQTSLSDNHDQPLSQRSSKSSHDQPVSQKSSHDPYTDKRPPKPQQRSSKLSKNSIQLNNFEARRVEQTRKAENIPITNPFQHLIPIISSKNNAYGITLYWKKQPQANTDRTENYRIIVDKKPYGGLISPQDEPKFQVNLASGKHECYLEIILKDKNEEILKSNVLNINVSSTGLKSQPQQKKEPLDTFIHKVVEQNDLPIPKLNVQTISPTSIRATWYLDRPIPADVYVAMYEVHIRGKDFSDQITSDESLQQNGYTEHIWNLSHVPLEITGISDQEEYVVFVRALYHVQGLNDTKYLVTKSNEIKTTRIDPLIELLTRPLLQVTRIGLQTAYLSWKLDDSVDQTLIKGYRMILNSKPTEILPPDQHEYELRNLKPGTTNEIQVSVTSHPDFVDEKISEPIRIVCAKRPQPPTIQAIPAEKPFSIRIKWKLENQDQDEITSFKIFLDGKLHGEIDTNGRHSFKYDFIKLQADKTYTIYVKSLLGQKKLDGNIYQCDVESNASNELTLKCAAPPKGTTPRVERMHKNGIDIAWDAPTEHGDVKLTGYQILKNGRSIGKSIPLDQRRASIKDLELGSRYAFQVVPITDQPGGTLFRKGEEYDPDRHGHYLPGEKLDVEFAGLVQLPKDLWVEQISGRSAFVCWSPADESTNSNSKPDSYKMSIWNNKDLTRDKPMIMPIKNDQTSVRLKDLQPNTTYELQLEACKKRQHPTTKDSYTVTSVSQELTFVTGAPPDPPSNLHIIACTNTGVRIGFDPFIEHNAEIKILRVQCEPVSSETKARETSIDITPDSTEFILTNLIERTEYNVTIYGITEEYLNENRCRDTSQLPKKLKQSEWLPNKSIPFQTSGCEPSNEIKIRQATIESIKLEWILGKAYGSTELNRQILRWQLERGGEEHNLELDRNIKKAEIPGPLPSGLYKISLDSIFSVKINLEESDDETSRKEISLTTNKSASVRFHTPPTCERPEIYLTGYTKETIDLAWNKPNMFDTIDHPEKNNEQLKVHCQLVGYRIDINKLKHNTIDKDQCRCTLTDCKLGDKYNVQLVAQTMIQNEYMDNTTTDDKENARKPDETPSEILSIQMLKNEDLLDSFQADFEFNYNDSNEITNNRRNEVTSLGKINVTWEVSDPEKVSHFIIQWRSSKDLRIQEKIVPSNETSCTIESADEKHYYVINIIIVTNEGKRQEYIPLAIPVPGAPDAPKLWLVKTSNTSFTVEWSEPKSYGIPVIGYQLFIAGKKSGDMMAVNLRRFEIPSHINRTYQVNVCAVTNNSQRPHSAMSQTLPVITTPTTDLVPTVYYNNDDGGPTSFDSNIARIIPLQIEPVNEDKLHLDWTSFLHTPTIRAYYIHYTCLNNGDIQAMKVSTRNRHAVLRGLRPGFTYGIIVMAVDKNGGVLYTSDKSTVQMNAPPNAPIVAISERANSHVKLEWRPAPSYGGVTVEGYKIYVNNRLAAILSREQLTYTLTNGIPCDTYTVHVQTLTNDKNILSPMSRAVQFAWPGIKPGSFKRIDDGQTGTITVAWEHPQLEDEMEKIIGYKLYSENALTHAVRCHGEYDAGTHQGTINGLNNGKNIVWLEIQSENYCVRSRPITVMSGRFNTIPNRQMPVDSPKCIGQKQKRFRSIGPNTTTPALRHTQYS
ncbi:unnamed protein product [Adineta steineri]|uniref:Fibronectin type-III domain-containing protein n=2 Tax=Adineta steineri TaxID=433720 RepID=A0A813YEF8_9BILA|nr:unnamed protein product [Adineta steineri]CAF3559754.1 unnamed protein product [Adineta steineri]